MATAPFNPNEALPADTDIVSQFPGVERTFRDIIEDWILVDHNNDPGGHAKITLDRLSSAPTGVASKSTLYGWTSVIGLFVRDETNSHYEFVRTGAASGAGQEDGTILSRFYDFATQAEAQAGTENTKPMTALRVEENFNANIVNTGLAVKGTSYAADNGSIAIYGGATGYDLYLRPDGPGSTTGQLQLSNSGALYAQLGTALLPAYAFTGDANTGIYSSAADTLDFTTGGTRAGYFDSSQDFNLVGELKGVTGFPFGNILAWVNFNGTGTLAVNDHYNCSSVTDNGTGDYTLNFDTALANANYVPIITVTGATAANVTGIGVIKGVTASGPTDKTTTTLTIQTGSSATGGLFDFAEVNVLIVGNIT